MTPKIVGTLSSYKNLNQRDWLWKQTPHHFGVWKDIQMLTTETQPDFLLLYQYDFAQQPKNSFWWNNLNFNIPGLTFCKWTESVL